MEYLWFKAFHVATVAIWIGGMLMLSLAVAALPASASGTPATPSPMIEAVARWNRWVTSPAMLLAWGLGITMAVQADWFTAPWLLIKLPIVLGLSAVHGALSGRLRRRTGLAGQETPSLLRFAGPATVVGIVVVAILAVAKPV
ncbi:CopD family protein [Pelagibius sp. Alg239-R121]|uniref:CopD family protein n=1 Tax=Pelagibius sp. Alg239-R121 TaxID=2993448 RepID=UPI0024A679D6|nr:CopD family protein [Pelagibius sp. Alg239-R121]